MKLLVVDDERIALRGMVRLLNGMYPDAEIVSSQDPTTALMLFDADVDVAFLDIEMPGMTGLELAEHLISEKKNLNIIFVTAYPEFALQAYDLLASGYLTKPVDESRLLRQMENLRFPLEEKEKKGVLQAKCFGNFDAFCEGVPLHFSRSSSKEVLAYLIDRKGASVTIEEICSNFWEDSVDIERKKTNVRTMIKALRKTLEENGLKNVLISQRNSYAIDPSLVECDYYQYLDNEEKGKKLFHGEYMSQYTWAERTLGNLTDWLWE